ncbi:MAG TPA: hypothetical protein O0X50_01670 [Methanocorpusculum sp.]|nr:hypothetical protein [Methanocorpusculum sp.]
MTVELQIPFGNNQFAWEFMDYLKENGCDSKMGLAFDENATVVTYGGYIAAMEALFSAVEVVGKEDPVWEKKARAVQRGRAWIAEIKAGVDLLYEKCEPGVEYAEYEDIYAKVFGIDLKILFCKDCGGNEEIRRQQQELNKKHSCAFHALGVLEGNDCVCCDKEKRTVTFLGPAKPFGELGICTRDEGIFDCFLPEELETAGIHVNQDQSLQIISVVVPEPAFARMNIEKILEHFNDDLDTDQGATERIRLYSDLFRCVRDAVKTGEVASEELKEKMLGVFEGYEDLSDAHDVCIQLILDNMSQAGCIVCEDGMVKPGK